MFRITQVILALLATQFAHAQNCQSSGTLLISKSAGETYVLLAGHKNTSSDSSHYKRGWSGFGGSCLGRETTLEAAITESHQETRGTYSVVYLEDAFKNADTISHNGLVTFFVYVDLIPDNSISTNPIPNSKSEYDERSPYRWVAFEALLKLVKSSDSDTVNTNSLIGNTEYQIDYLYPILTKSLRSMSEEQQMIILNKSPTQGKNETTSEVFKSLNAIKKDIDDLKEVISSSSDESIGLLTMNSKAELHSSKELPYPISPNDNESLLQNPQEIEIDRIELRIEDGGIKNIKVHTIDNRLFSRYNLNVSLSDLIPGRRPFFYYSRYIYDSQRNFLLINDLLEWEASIDGEYTPNDETIVLGGGSPTEASLDIGTSLNSYLNVKVYSDLFGVFGNQENGLIQTEVSGRLDFFTRQLNRSLQIMRYVEIGGRISKFDDDFEEIKINTSEVPLDSLFLDRLALNRLSFLSLSAKINIIRTIPVQNFRYGIDMGWNYDFVNFTVDGGEQRTLNLLSTFIEAHARLIHYKNFGLDWSQKFIFQEITQRDDLSDLVIVNGGITTLGVTELELFYNPANQKDQRIYLRFRSMRDRKRHFDWLQFGYSTQFGFK